MFFNVNYQASDCPETLYTLNLSERAKFCASPRLEISSISLKSLKWYGVQVWTDSDGLGARCIGETRFSCAWDIAIFVRVHWGVLEVGKRILMDHWHDRRL